MKKVAINGFGGIGRMTLRAYAEKKNKPFQIVCINDIGDEGALNIFSNLKTNIPLNSLNIGDNNITDAGIKNILYFLRDRPFRMLNLNRNKITYHGTKIISDMLEKNYSIDQINIGKNKLDDLGIIQICKALHQNTNLNLLNLRQVNMEEEGAKALAELLIENKTLRILNICDNDIKNNGLKYVVDALKFNKNIEFIYTSDNNFNKIGEQYLTDLKKRNPKVQIAHYIGEHTTFNDPMNLEAILKGRANIKTLNIVNHKFTLDELTILTEKFKLNNNIEALQIKNAGLDATFSNILTTMIGKNLKALSLQDNYFDETNLEFLLESLSKIEKLKILNLRNNKLRLNGAKKVARYLGSNSKFEYVDLSHNYVGFEFIEEICKYYDLDRLVWKF